MSIAKLLAGAPTVSVAHADVILEIAYLMTAVDGRLGDDEIEAFQQVIATMRGTQTRPQDVDALLDRFAGNVDADEIAGRVKTIAPTLPKELRGFAFKVAVGLALVDMAAGAEEDELKDLLIESLELDEDETDDMVEAAHEAFQAD